MMPTLTEAPASATRNQPIAEGLRAVLLTAAAAARIDEVRVVSGGQPPAPATRRTGSTRHDYGNAADIKLVKDGRALDFTSQDRPMVEAFVRAAASLGATGIGAAVDYMGPETLHVGFGARAVWGADGASVNAPDWLRRAAVAGWAAQSGAPVTPSGRERIARALQAALDVPVDGIWGDESRDAYKRFDEAG